MTTPTRIRALLGALLLGGGLLVLPGVASAADTTPTCADFTSQAAAQQAFEAGAATLDGDGDGIACESLLLDQISALQCGSDYADQVQTLQSEIAALPTVGGGAGDGTDATGTDDGTAGDGTDGTDGTDADPETPVADADGSAAADATPDATPDGVDDGADLLTLLEARQATLNGCVATTTTDVDPTASDGSVPITSGDQVSVVPEGSAATGEA